MTAIRVWAAAQIILDIPIGGGSVGKGLGVAFRGCGCLVVIIALALLFLAD